MIYYFNCSTSMNTESTCFLMAVTLRILNRFKKIVLLNQNEKFYHPTKNIKKIHEIGLQFAYFFGSLDME